MKRVGILTCGGDCAGLNAVISAAVKTGLKLGYEMVGFEYGWEGVLSPMRFRPLALNDVRGISYHGGTIIKTTNRGRFAAKAGAGDRRRIPTEILDEAKHNLASIGVDAIIVIGGDGSLTGALQLFEHGVNVVGVPKSIDNDLSATDRTFGYSTGVQVVVEALDRIHTTASSHDRVIFVETMGRHAGWIALRAGLAGGADAILLPEFPFKIKDFVEFLHYRQRMFGSCIVAVAEGAKIEDRLVTRTSGATQEVLLGGVSTRLIQDVEALAPSQFDMRGTVLGHVQRGGTPNAADRVLAKSYGVAAMHAVRDEEYGHMVCYNSLHMCTVPIATAVGQLKVVTPDTMEYRTARDLDIFIH